MTHSFCMSMRACGVIFSIVRHPHMTVKFLSVKPKQWQTFPSFSVENGIFQDTLNVCKKCFHYISGQKNVSVNVCDLYLVGYYETFFSQIVQMLACCLNHCLGLCGHLSCCCYLCYAMYLFDDVLWVKNNHFRLSKCPWYLSLDGVLLSDNRFSVNDILNISQHKNTKVSLIIQQYGRLMSLFPSILRTVVFLSVLDGRRLNYPWSSAIVAMETKPVRFAFSISKARIYFKLIDFVFEMK